MLIAAAGYLINDIIDHEADKINKPDKIYLGEKFTKNKAIGIYVLLNLIGLEIAWILANQVGNKYLMLIYPASVLLLYLYSLKFKSIPLIGNIVVSFFCAGVAGIVLFAERKTFLFISHHQPDTFLKLNLLFCGYIIFSFFSTLSRELIKDAEDLEGDKKTGVKTLPTVYGIPLAKKFILSINLILIGLTISATAWLFNSNYRTGSIYSLLFIFFPFVFIAYQCLKSNEKKDFSKLSKWTKWTMVSGLVLLIIISA